VKLPTLLLSSVLLASTSLPQTSLAQNSGASATATSATTAAATPKPAPHDQFSLPETDAGLPGTGPIRRYDWFKNLWHSQRAGWAERASKEQNSIVFLGDSITQLWGDVASYFPGIKTANRGISGDTTRGVLIRLQDVFDLHPRGIVLLIGTNDLDEKAEPETIASNLKLILEAIRNNNSNTPVVLCSVFPSSESQRRPAAKIRKVNELYRDVAQSFPQVTILDTYALFADVHGDAKADIFPDLLHPNVHGYGDWAGALRPIFETLGLAPTWPDDFKPEPGFTSLFNGHDLTGWTYQDDPSLEGKTDTSDRRYGVRNGRLVVMVSPLLRAYRTLWTTQKFPHDFVLKLEFRASPNADSGIFIREPQLQCRDYLIAGPFTRLRHYHPLDWNEIVVTVKGGLAHCTCNGEVIQDAMPVPATGAIGLESDHGQMEYRRIRISETP
jgi:lysophospholipase L1-like esterase